jgi:hypothetical protein
MDASKTIDDGDEEEEEDVDVVGEDELNEADDDRSMNEADHSTLAHDLQLSPENSSLDDDERPPSAASPSHSVGRLSSDSDDGADFENVDDAVLQPGHDAAAEMAAYAVDDEAMPMAFGVPYVGYDDNAQDFVSYIDVGDGMEQVAAYGAADDDDGELDNFDPQSFFSSIAQGVVQEQQQQQQMEEQDSSIVAAADINNDLQVSESEDGDDVAEDPEMEDVDVDDPEAEFVSVDDNDDADFDMTEFLQRAPPSD